MTQRRTLPLPGWRLPLMVGAAALAQPAPVFADVVYFGLQNVAIPFGTGFAALDGVFLDLETGATSSTPIAGWDINPFFGGSLFASSPGFLPARTGPGNEDAIRSFPVATAVDGSATYVQGFGGSASHLGLGPQQFASGHEAYLGFRFTPDGGAGPLHGWMRVIFTANTPGGMLMDWAYETGGGAIQTGGVLRSSPASGISTVTLSAAATTASTLGTALDDLSGGVVTEILKTGPGAWTLAGAHTFTGTTTISEGGGTLELSGQLSGSEAVVIHTGGTLLLSGAGGEDGKLAPGAAVTLAGGTIALSDLSTRLTQTVGTLTLSASSTLDFGTLAAGHSWTFGASPGDWSALELRILNYSPDVDRLFFGTHSATLEPSQLARISFFSDGGITPLGTAQFSGDPGQVVPVPEPTGVTLGAGLLGLALWREQRRRPRRPLSAG